MNTPDLRQAVVAYPTLQAAIFPPAPTTLTPSQSQDISVYQLLQVQLQVHVHDILTCACTFVCVCVHACVHGVCVCVCVCVFNHAYMYVLIDIGLFPYRAVFHSTYHACSSGSLPTSWPHKTRLQKVYMYVCVCLLAQPVEKVAVSTIDAFYQPGACSAPDWSYSYFAISCLFVRLSVCPSEQDLERPENELMVAAGTYGWFVYLLAAKGSETMPILSTVEAQLSLHKCNIATAAPEAREWQETGG